MRSRWVRLISSVAALAAFGGAGFFVYRSEQHIARTRGAAQAFNDAVRDAAGSLSELRMSQAAYVATGQDVAFWAPKATAAAAGLNASVAQLRSMATTEV